MELKDILIGVALGTAATVGYNNLDDETKAKISKALGNIGDETKGKIKNLTGLDLDEQVKSAKGAIDKAADKYNVDDVIDTAKDNVSKVFGAISEKTDDVLSKLSEDKD
ncbi:MAG: hypothetical protein LBC17_00125 [Lactobacillaceae bacterium]|nr:hypothetical protein [Lactobacillaceae bacterium]